VSTVDLLTGLGMAVAAAGLAVWDPERVWTADDTDTAVLIGRLPQQPSNVIAMTAYTIRDDPHLNDSTVGVQFKMRGDVDEASVYAMNDTLFDLFHGMHDTTVNGVPVALAWRQNSLPGPQDQSDRWQHNASFYFQVAWPTRYRTD
jgi:hypothetical protein